MLALPRRVKVAKPVEDVESPIRRSRAKAPRPDREVDERKHGLKILRCQSCLAPIKMCGATKRGEECPVRGCGGWLHLVAPRPLRHHLVIPDDPEYARLLIEEAQLENGTAPISRQKNERRNVLEEAADLIDGARQDAYGPPSVNFQRIADMLNGMFGPKLTAPLTRGDVAAIMICLKLSRQVNSSKRDNWVDIAGYAGLGAEVDGT